MLAHLFSNLWYVSLYMYQTFINTAGKSFSVVTLYVAMILQMKDSWSANFDA